MPPIEEVGRECRNSKTIESLEKHLHEMRLVVEERGQEVRERNQLLVKARKAIEDLQADVILARERLSEAEGYQQVDAALRHQVLKLEARERRRSHDLDNVSVKVRELESALSDARKSCAVHVRTLAARDKALLDGGAQRRNERKHNVRHARSWRNLPTRKHHLKGRLLAC